MYNLCIIPAIAASLIWICSVCYQLVRLFSYPALPTSSLNPHYLEYMEDFVSFHSEIFKKVQFMYSLCEVYVQFMHISCRVPVQCKVYSLCTRFSKCTIFSLTIHELFMYTYTCTLNDQFMISLWLVYNQCRVLYNEHCTVYVHCSVYVQFIKCLCTV